MKTTYLQKLKQYTASKDTCYDSTHHTNFTNSTNSGGDLSAFILQKRSQLIFEYPSLSDEERSRELDNYKELIKQKRSEKPDYKVPAILVLKDAILGTHTLEELVETTKYSVAKMVTRIPDGLADIDENDPKLKKIAAFIANIEEQASNRQYDLGLETIIREALQNSPGTNILIDRNGRKEVSLGAGLTEFGLEDPRVGKILDLIRNCKTANL